VSLWLKGRWFATEAAEMEKVGGCTTGRPVSMPASEGNRRTL